MMSPIVESVREDECVRIPLVLQQNTQKDLYSIHTTGSDMVVGN